LLLLATFKAYAKEKSDLAPLEMIMTPGKICVIEPVSEKSSNSLSTKTCSISKVGVTTDSATAYRFNASRKTNKQIASTLGQ
jgi:hypothetical protein